MLYNSLHRDVGFGYKARRGWNFTESDCYSHMHTAMLARTAVS